MKICTNCNQEKQDESFRLRKETRGKQVTYYRNNTCRECDILLYKKYRSNNPDKVRETKRNWESKNKDKKAEMDRRYRLKMGKILYERRTEATKNNIKYKRKCCICGSEYFNRRQTKYCSYVCYGKYLKEKRIKFDNPNYKTGNTVGYKTWENNRKKIIDSTLSIYGFIFCHRCNTSVAEAFHVHHIIYRSEAPKHKNLHNTDNMILLCAKCHSWLHNQKSRRDYLIIERKLWILFPEYIKDSSLPPL